MRKQREKTGFVKRVCLLHFFLFLVFDEKAHRRKKESISVSPKMRCLYEVLEVARDAEAGDIKTAYRKGALRWHPGEFLGGGGE